jgi:hypothetical protein
MICKKAKEKICVIISLIIDDYAYKNTQIYCNHLIIRSAIPVPILSKITFTSDKNVEASISSEKPAN